MSNNSTTEIPRHLGIILDGNRRWARSRGKPTLQGHKEGAKVFKTIVFEAFDKGIPFVSAFVFSTENWARTKQEVSYLMSLVTRVTEKYLKEFNDRGIRVVIIGDKQGLDPATLESINKTENVTKNNQGPTLALCFNYGGQDEIIRAVSSLIKDHPKSDTINKQTFEQYLCSKDLPEVDAIIRTSGEHRLSGFMMWKAAYAELIFVDKMWPDFTTNDLSDALIEYSKRKRRYGS